MSDQITITGMEGINRSMKLLNDPRQVRRKARKAARKAMKIVQDKARENARAIDDPETQKMIYKNIVVRGGKSRNPNTVVIRVGVNNGGEFWSMNRNMIRVDKATGNRYRLRNPHYTYIQNDTRSWWLVEFGTKKTRAQPFMRIALLNSLQQVTDRFAEEFSNEIDLSLSTSS